MHTEPALFLSIRPRFAELLFAGSKTIELRRIAPSVAPGTTVLIYASSPVRALLGKAAVSAVDVADTDEIWQRHGEATGITRHEYDDYFAGAATAAAISLHGVRRLQTTVSLEELRRGRSWFHPPQSFRYLRGAQLASMQFV